MKKVLVFFGLALIFTFGYSQQRESYQGTTVKNPLKVTDEAKEIYDTLRPSSLSNASAEFTLHYTVSDTSSLSPLVIDTGYVFGTNKYKDSAKAQFYLVENEGYNVLGGYVWVGRAVGTGDIYFNVYDSDGNATGCTNTYEGLPYTTGPGTILASSKVDLSDIPEANDNTSEGTYYYFSFENPARVERDFYLGVNMYDVDFPENEFAVFATKNGFGDVNETWEQWESGSWYSAGIAYHLGVQMIICPAVSTLDNIQEDFINNVIMNIYPNPVVDEAKIDFELRNASSNVNFTIFDEKGRIVLSEDFGAANAGANSVNLNLSELPSGNYFYAIITDGSRLAKPFVK